MKHLTRSLVLISMPMAASLLSLILFWVCIARDESDAQVYVRTKQVITETHIFLRKYEALHRSVIGFVSIGDRNHDETYQKKRQETVESLRRVRSLLSDDPLQERKLAEALPVFDRSFALFDRVRNLATSGNKVEALSAFNDGSVMREAEYFNDALASFLNEEERLDTLHEENFLETRGWLKRVTVASLLSVFLLSALVFQKMNRNVFHRIALLIEAIKEVKRGAAVRASFLKQGDEIDRLVESFQNLNNELTERRRNERHYAEVLEQQVVRRTSLLVRLNEDLKRSNKDLKDFAVIASHDLQEPLRKIRAFGDRLNETLKEVQLPGNSRDYLQRMLAATERMQRLVTDLLAVSRLSTEVVPAEKVDLNRLVHEILSDLDACVTERARFEIYSLPAIEGHECQLRQVFQNLILNSLKFKRKEVDPVIRIVGARANSSVRITYSDNGIGFEPQYAEKIFGFFQRLHARNVYEGSGVGLAVCRRIVERHGGDISAMGALGEGATFFIDLPLARHFVEASG